MAPHTPRSSSRLSPASSHHRSTFVDGELTGKRRQRSESSPEAFTHRRRSRFSSSDGIDGVDGEDGVGDGVDRSPSSPSAVFPTQSTRSGHSATPNEDSSSGRTNQPGEDGVTVRRREANRLAAQRFRSRKKGYQDSLEERIRQLEDEKELLARRLADVVGTGPRSTHSFSPDGDSRPRLDGHARPGDTKPYLSSPERKEPVDVEIRIASLESANRSLQDDVRTVTEENDRLHDELEQWRRWEREHRESRTTAAYRRNDRRPMPLQQSSLPSYDRPSGNSISRSPQAFIVTPYSSMSRSPVHMPPPPISPVDGFPRPSSPGIRLPPIRLAPLHIPGIDYVSPVFKATFPPRPAELNKIVPLASPTYVLRPEDRSRRV